MACGQGCRFRAAGGSGDKLLADLAGVPLIVRTAASVPADAFETVLVARDRAVAGAVGAAVPRVDVVLADRGLPPRSEVVRLGLSRGRDRWDGCLFLPGDQPLVRTESFRALAAAFTADPARAWRLSWEGVPGSPVLFPGSSFDALDSLEGGEGGGALLRRGALPVSLVGASVPEELIDVDTPADLEAAARFLAGGR